MHKYTDTPHPLAIESIKITAMLNDITTEGQFWYPSLSYIKSIATNEYEIKVCREEACDIYTYKLSMADNTTVRILEKTVITETQG